MAKHRKRFNRCCFELPGAVRPQASLQSACAVPGIAKRMSVLTRDLSGAGGRRVRKIGLRQHHFDVTRLSKVMVVGLSRGRGQRSRSKRYARDNLSGSRCRTGAVHPVDISIAARQTSLIVFGSRRHGIGAHQYSTAAAAELYGLWTGQKQTVEHVVEFGPDFEFDV